MGERRKLKRTCDGRERDTVTTRPTPVLVVAVSAAAVVVVVVELNGNCGCKYMTCGSVKVSAETAKSMNSSFSTVHTAVQVLYTVITPRSCSWAFAFK